jgi:CheY-like chemotaxis protein
MKEELGTIHPDDIYVRTALGSASVDDAGRPLSAGFREMLRAIDGKRKVSELNALFPRLDEEDVALWLGELLRMGLIDMAEVPFDLPAIRTDEKGRVAAASPAEAPAAAAVPAGGALDEFDVAAMAANVEQWLRQDTDTLTRASRAGVDLNATIQQAALQSTQALATLKDSGFFANLMEPLKLGGRQPMPRPTSEKQEALRKVDAAALSGSITIVPPAAPKPLAAPATGSGGDGGAPALPRKGLALVFESDPADTALLSRLLNDAGYQAQLCATRQQLLMLLNQPLVPEMIFLKLGARDVDVFKVLEKLRAHHRLGKAAVIIMAEKPSREDIAKSILLGASGWVAKPYSAEAVAAAVRGVMTFPQG